ncbi:MAG: hypothetical protein KDJ38_01540 [Gammaproteobacteria bacterium]|nr:hypothetical protein [Gammaproteobacteria bacterium]
MSIFNSSRIQSFTVAVCAGLLLAAAGVAQADSHGKEHKKNGHHGHGKNKWPGEDGFSLEWNEECTALTVVSDDEDTKLNRVSFFDSVGNGPYTITSGRHNGLSTPLDLSTTELQAYISPTDGGEIWINARGGHHRSGHHNKRSGNNGVVKLTVPSCTQTVSCPYTEEFAADFDYLLANNVDWIEAQFYGFDGGALDCSSPIEPVSILAVDQSSGDPTQYFNTYINAGSEWFIGITYFYDSIEEAKACAIYLGCTEQ